MTRARIRSRTREMQDKIPTPEASIKLQQDRNKLRKGIDDYHRSVIIYCAYYATINVPCSQMMPFFKDLDLSAGYTDEDDLGSLQPYLDRPSASDTFGTNSDSDGSDIVIALGTPANTLDDTSYPEDDSLLMPSYLDASQRSSKEIQKLALQELQLRQAQANDSLESLRLALANKSLRFRKDVRTSKTYTTRNSAWLCVDQESAKVSKHTASYNRARNAMLALQAPDSILSKYLPISHEDLKMPSDILEENRVGQRSDTLAWFWRMGQQGDASMNSEWHKECMCYGVIISINSLCSNVLCSLPN